MQKDIFVKLSCTYTNSNTEDVVLNYMITNKRAEITFLILRIYTAWIQHRHSRVSNYCPQRSE
jgi:hypothetical protein